MIENLQLNFRDFLKTSGTSTNETERNTGTKMKFYHAYSKIVI